MNGSADHESNVALVMLCSVADVQGDWRREREREREEKDVKECERNKQTK
jgi:hypothetical protein